MDRSIFDSLKVQEQLNYVNGELKKGNSLTQIAKGLNMSRSTLSRRFQKINYKYDDEAKQYRSNTEVIQNNLVIQKQDKSITNNENYKSDTKVIQGEDYKSIIKVIQDMKGQLEEVYDWYDKQRNIVDIKPIELKISKFKGEPTNKSYKLYSDVQEQFKAFCDNHKQYKVQDLISQALVEFIEKYK